MDRKIRELAARMRFAAKHPLMLAMRRRLNGAGSALATTDGRWAIVSTSVTAVVAGAVAWMAMGVMPVSRPLVGPASRTPLSYELFMKLMHAGDFGPGQNQGAPDNSDHANPNPDVENRTVTLDAGDTLVGMLEDVGISAQDANAVVTAMGKDFNPRALKAGQNFDLTYSIAKTIDASGKAAPKTTVVMVNNKPVTVPVDAEAGDGDVTSEESQPISRLLSLHFSPTVEQDITVTRTTEGGFTAELTQKKLEVHRHRAGATIDSSLYLAAMQAGIPADVVVDMIHMFSYKVDFQRDLHPGDRFEVYYDYYYTPDGQPAKDGNIAYAMLELDGKQIALYRYQPDPDQPADYFDPKGQSAKGLLMKTPVDGARISSGFGSRFHPILGYTRMHKGVDFAVPIGTPVMAAGGGTVKFMGRARGYGNFVLINHGNGYATAYGHLSRFAPGMHAGSRVRQGQIFAFSGMTGMATGPHLHYEIRINSKQVNPLKVKMAQGRMLAGKALRGFLAHRLKVDNDMATMPLEMRVADNAADLRQAKAK